MKGLDTSFFNSVTVKRPVREGDLLIAQPFLDEAWFRRGVISLIDYDRSEGATGVVLNNCMNYVLSDVLEGVATSTDVPVYCGGPMSQDRLYFIHTLGERILPGARLYAPGLYIGGDFDAAIQYVNEGYPTEGVLRFFIGYSGWAPGQLEDEIGHDTWAIMDAPEDAQGILSGEGFGFWYRMVRRLGEPYRSWRMIPEVTYSN